MKWKFHKLWSEDPIAYNKKLYQENPVYRRNILNYQKKYTKEHPEINRKAKVKYNKDHKTWMIKNCLICGRFCSKYSKKYCKDCNEIMQHGTYSIIKEIRNDI